MALLAIRSDFSSPSESYSPGESTISGTINGRHVHNMKRDNGASMSFVDSALLEPNYVRGEPVQITTMQGVASYPTTTVRLGLNGHHRKLRMAISTGFTFDALLGTDIPDLKKLLTYAKRKQPRRSCQARGAPPPRDTSTEEEEETTGGRKRRQPRGKPRYPSPQPAPSTEEED